MLIFT